MKISLQIANCRENRPRDRFASDCIVRQPVSLQRVTRAKSRGGVASGWFEANQPWAPRSAPPGRWREKQVRPTPSAAGSRSPRSRAGRPGWRGAGPAPSSRREAPAWRYHESIDNLTPAMLTSDPRERWRSSVIPRTTSEHRRILAAALVVAQKRAMRLVIAARRSAPCTAFSRSWRSRGSSGRCLRISLRLPSTPIRRLLRWRAACWLEPAC